MPDPVIDILSSSSETLHIRHNAHHETQTTVARHLLHRARMGETISFASTAARVICMESETLWEVSLRQPDGSQIHVAGISLEECLEMASAMTGKRAIHAIAA